MKKPFFTAKKVNDHITTIWSGCGEIMYLIQGEDRAVLMDTNLGVKGLRALVERLTDKPYEVILTHGHIDHAMGAPEFAGKAVYLNHKDIPVYQSMCALEGRKGYIGPLVAEYGLTDEDFVPETPDFAFRDLADGQTFDLGGITVITYAFPGHTQGCMALFIPELRTLITGDACNNSTFLFDDICTTVEEYQRNVRHMKTLLAGKYDHVYLCHHVMEAAPDILEEMDELCDDIYAGRTDDVPFDFMGKHAFIAKKANQFMQRDDGKFANLIYRKERIR